MFLEVSLKKSIWSLARQHKPPPGTRCTSPEVERRALHQGHRSRPQILFLPSSLNHLYRVTARSASVGFLAATLSYSGGQLCTCLPIWVPGHNSHLPQPQRWFLPNVEWRCDLSALVLRRLSACSLAALLRRLAWITKDKIDTIILRMLN